LHRIIHWSSGKKDLGELFETPKKLFDDFLTKGVLTPSGIMDSPNEVKVKRKMPKLSLEHT